MKNRKVLITGSNGLLGQKLTDLYLRVPEVQLIATGLNQNRHPEEEGFIYELLDISDEKQVHDVIGRHKPDCIINTAAMTNVDACEENKKLCDALNVNAVKYLCEAAEKAGAHLIHLSTDFIFDGEAGPYKEIDKPNPLSYYGESKLKGENIVKQDCSKWAIIRTVLVYGLVTDMSRSNIVLWAKESLEKNREIHVVDDQFRSPTLAEDLAMGCFLVESQQKTGIYNISGKDQLNIFELVARVAKKYDLSMDNVHRTNSSSLNQKAVRPPVTGFDLSKSIIELGYQPHSLSEGMDLLDEQVKAAIAKRNLDADS
jgi:dTDP-4-dehydrorhamnose reductase